MWPLGIFRTLRNCNARINRFKRSNELYSCCVINCKKVDLSRKYVTGVRVNLRNSQSRCVIRQIILTRPKSFTSTRKMNIDGNTESKESENSLNLEITSVTSNSSHENEDCPVVIKKEPCSPVPEVIDLKESSSEEDKQSATHQQENVPDASPSGQPEVIDLKESSSEEDKQSATHQQESVPDTSPSGGEPEVIYLKESSSEEDKQSATHQQENVPDASPSGDSIAAALPGVIHKSEHLSQKDDCEKSAEVSSSTGALLSEEVHTSSVHETGQPCPPLGNDADSDVDRILKSFSEVLVEYDVIQKLNEQAAEAGLKIDDLIASLEAWKHKKYQVDLQLMKLCMKQQTLRLEPGEIDYMHPDNYEYLDPESEEEVVNVVFIHKNGKVQDIRGKIGDNLLKLALRFRVPVEGACEGQLACTSCHCYVDDKYFDMLDEKGIEEEDMLDQAPFLRENSRLGCQIILRKELEGLRLTLPRATINFYCGNPRH